VAVYYKEVKMEAGEIARNLQLTDAGRLLVIFESAHRGNEDMSEKEVDGIAYLLTEKNILPFGYPFLLNPLPYSTRLHEDLYRLIQTEYLYKKNPIYISPKGSAWVSETLSQHGYNWDTLATLIQTIKDLLTAYRRQAFDLIYTAMTS
jgi:hypothetical protein